VYKNDLKLIYIFLHVTALDPAGPWFKEPENRDKAIKCTDAKKIKVIHTNTDYYGYPDKICPDDLFPNGGRKQPVCRSIFRINKNMCSHKKAWKIYMEQKEN